MDLIKTTQSKIDYCEQRLKDLENCLSQDFITKDAIVYISKEIYKTLINKQYFMKIMEVLRNE